MANILKSKLGVDLSSSRLYQKPYMPEFDFVSYLSSSRLYQKPYMRMLRIWIRWESFLRELLSGGRREWLGLQLLRVGLWGKSSPCSAAATLDSSIRDCTIPRFLLEKTGRDEAMVFLYNLFEGVSSISVLPDLFHVNNSLKQVRFYIIECFSELPFCFSSWSWVFCRMTCWFLEWSSVAWGSSAEPYDA